MQICASVVHVEHYADIQTTLQQNLKNTFYGSFSSDYMTTLALFPSSASVDRGIQYMLGCLHITSITFSNSNNNSNMFYFYFLVKGSQKKILQKCNK